LYFSLFHTTKQINLSQFKNYVDGPLERIQKYINEGKITGTTGFKNLAYMSSIMVEYKDVMTTIKPPSAVIKVMSRVGKLFGYK
jgi:hypothetical protein